MTKLTLTFCNAFLMGIFNLHISFLIISFGVMKNIITLLSVLFVLASCSKDDDGCNCKGAIYRNVWTDELKTYHNEPMDCETNTPIEPVKDEKWYFVECKNNPSY